MTKSLISSSFDKYINHDPMEILNTNNFKIEYIDRIENYTRFNYNRT